MMTHQAVTHNLEETHTEVETFDWRRCWHPVAFVVDLPIHRPYAFEVYGEPYVLFQDSGQN